MKYLRSERNVMSLDENPFLLLLLRIVVTLNRQSLAPFTKRACNNIDPCARQMLACRHSLQIVDTVWRCVWECVWWGGLLWVLWECGSREIPMEEFPRTRAWYKKGGIAEIMQNKAVHTHECECIVAPHLHEQCPLPKHSNCAVGGHPLWHVLEEVSQQNACATFCTLS